MSVESRIIIAGAGPVGLLAAQALRKLGYRPIVYEKRYKADIRNVASTIAGPPPWGSRDRTRGIALHGATIDAIRQLCQIDLVDYPGLHQIHCIHWDVDGTVVPTNLPNEAGWWRSSKPTTQSAQLSAEVLSASIVDDSMVAMIGIAELEHYLLTDDIEVTFGIEVMGAKPEEGKGRKMIKVFLRDQTGQLFEDSADLLLITTGGGSYHAQKIPGIISATAPQSETLLAELGYTLHPHQPHAVLLWDVAWSVPSPNQRQVLGVYGDTGFGSFTGVRADFPEFSKVTAAIPDVIWDDEGAQKIWVNNVAHAMDIPTTNREILFGGRYWAYQSQLTSVVAPKVPFTLALGDAYMRTTPMNGRNFQTAVPLLLKLVGLLRDTPEILQETSAWLSAMKEIEQAHEAFASKVLDISYRVGRPLDQVAYAQQYAAFAQ